MDLVSTGGPGTNLPWIPSDLYTFWLLDAYQMYDFQNFLPFCREKTFHFLDNVL